MLPIKFLNPTCLDPARERCSKLLDPKSKLYQHLSTLRERLLTAYPWRIAHPPRMDFHIEVIKWGTTYTETEMLERCAELQGQLISPSTYAQMGKAIVIPTPKVSGYGPTHITLAWFPEGIVSIEELQNVLNRTQ